MFNDFPSSLMFPETFIVFIRNQLICIDYRFPCKQDSIKDVLVHYIVFPFLVFAGI